MRSWWCVCVLVAGCHHEPPRAAPDGALAVCSEPSFVAWQSVPIQASTLAVGELSRDVFARSQGGSLASDHLSQQWLLRNWGNAFQRVPLVSSMDSCGAVVIADVDGDYIPDVACAHGVIDGIVEIERGQQDNTLLDPVRQDAPRATGARALATWMDLGHAPLVYVDGTDTIQQVTMSTPTLTTTPLITLPETGLQAITSTTVNPSGPSLVVANATTLFTIAPSTHAVTSVPTSIAMTQLVPADINNDARWDVIGLSDAAVGVAMTRDDALTSPVVTSFPPAPAPPWKAVVARLDYDDIPDILLVDKQLHSTWLRGNSDGTFAAPAPFPIEGEPRTTPDTLESIVAAQLDTGVLDDLAVGVAHADGTTSVDIYRGCQP